jgi:hypothetical protein
MTVDEVDQQSLDEAFVFATVTAVDESWCQIRAIPNYEAVAGEILFRKIFELAPGALGMFSFGTHFEVEEDGLYTSPLFVRHAKGVVQMLDAAIQMLGPDMEPLEFALKELGAKHTHYGVLPPHYSVVGEALLYTLGVALGDKWTPSVQRGWVGVYHFVSTSMMAGAEEYLAKKVSMEQEGRTRDSRPENADQAIRNTLYTERKVLPNPPSGSPRNVEKTKPSRSPRFTHRKEGIDKRDSSQERTTSGHRQRSRGILTWIDKALRTTVEGERRRRI